ncbi:MAG: hypothetical protein KBS62_01990 [Oscillospiraceae bacterium]|nr:hypothetical protein [Candidatus Ruminococcus equi]
MVTSNENRYKKIQKFFASDNLLKISVIVFTVLLTVNIISKFFIGLYSLCISDIVFMICIIVLFVAFKKHNKNVQKGLLGAVLMWYFLDELSYVLNSIVFSEDAFSQYQNFAGFGYIVLSLVTMVLFAAFFINHFILCGDHKSNPGAVHTELILGICMSVIALVSIGFQWVVLYPDFFGNVENVTWHIALCAYLTMVGSYEAHFEEWKELRETN